MSASIEATILPGTVLSFESFNGSDSGAVSSVQEGDFKVVNAQQDYLQDALQENDLPSLSSACLSTEISTSATLKPQITPEFTVSSAQKVQVEESVVEDDGIVTGNESDWESTSTPRASGREVISKITYSESTEFDSTVVENRGDDKNIPTDAWEMQTYGEDLQSGITVDACKTECESVVYTSNGLPCQGWAVENTADEQTTLEKKASEDLSEVNIKENAGKLAVCTLQEDSGEPGASNLLGVGVVASEDNPECGGEPLDSHSVDNVLVSDDGSKVTDASAGICR